MSTDVFNHLGKMAVVGSFRCPGARVLTKLRVFRLDKSGAEDGPRYDSFDVPSRQGMTVLDALFHAQDNIDDSLSFRYSCRGAVCGSCAMLIDKKPRLACRTQVSELLKDSVNSQVVVEPLPNLPILKDLIVDMTRFFDKYKVIEPYLKPVGEGETDTPEANTKPGNESDIGPIKENLMSPEAVKELETYTNCILCGACYGGCPVDGENKQYLGPAALAKLYRFHIDPREANDGSPFCNQRRNHEQ